MSFNKRKTRKPQPRIAYKSDKTKAKLSVASNNERLHKTSSSSVQWSYRMLDYLHVINFWKLDACKKRGIIQYAIRQMQSPIINTRPALMPMLG